MTAAMRTATTTIGVPASTDHGGEMLFAVGRVEPCPTFLVDGDVLTETCSGCGWLRDDHEELPSIAARTRRHGRRAA